MAAGDRPAKPRRKPAAKKAASSRGSAGSNEVTPDSSDTTSTDPPAALPPLQVDNPLGLEPDDFVPDEQPAPADHELEPEYEPTPPELVDWTPERAGFIVRGGGLLLHTADGLSREPGGEELWKATEDDIDAIAPPLARILNRYEPARRLAGLSDEGELLLGLGIYLRKNLVERGQIATAKRAREEPGEPEVWHDPTQPPPAT